MEKKQIRFKWWEGAQGDHYKIYKEEGSQNKKEPKDKLKVDTTMENELGATKINQVKTHSSEHSLNATKVEKKQTLVENESPLETIRKNVEKETSWEDQADEEDFKNNNLHFSKNDPSKLVENTSWSYVGKKGKIISPRKTRIQTKSKQK